MSQKQKSFASNGMLQTTATALLGIEYPIVCGGMTATGSPELAAAVSNAGGLGMLTALHASIGDPHGGPSRLDSMIKTVRSMTEKPFGVNLTILGEKRGTPEFPHEFARIITSNKIQIVETCGASIPLMRDLHHKLREGGVQVIISKCVHIRQAVQAQNELCPDMISLMGFDSGGLPGEADVGLFVQMALAKKRLHLPFLASGGVATGAQLLAALASGAAGVQIGTRFNATKECNVFPDSFKQRMIEAGDRSTVVVMKPFKASSRVLKNRTAEQIIRLQQEKGAAIKFKDIGALPGMDMLQEGLKREDPDHGIWNCGQSVCLIDDIPTVAELLQRIISEAKEQFVGLTHIFADGQSENITLSKL